MKEPKEILFEQYEVDPDGGLLIDDTAILKAMEIYAKQQAVNFMLNKLGVNVSRFEVERLYDIFNEKEVF